MLIEAALFNHLQSLAGVTALVGNRVYPKKLPQKPTLPAVVYHRVSTPRDHTHTGPDTMTSPRWQFDCHARSLLEARAVAIAVRGALDGFSGAMGALGADPGVQVDGAFAEDESDDYDDELETYVVLFDVMIQHQE